MYMVKLCFVYIYNSKWINDKYLLIFFTIASLVLVL